MITCIIITLALNALLGFIALNWAWKQARPILKQNESIDKQYPEFRRLDVSKWDKSRFMLGAVTIMPARFIIGVWVNLSLFVFVK